MTSVKLETSTQEELDRLRHAVYEIYDEPSNVKYSAKPLYTGPPVTNKQAMASIVRNAKRLFDELEEQGCFIGYWPKEGSICIGKIACQYIIPEQDRKAVLIRTDDEDFKGIQTYFARRTGYEKAKLSGRNSVIDLSHLDKKITNFLELMRKNNERARKGREDLHMYRKEKFYNIWGGNLPCEKLKWVFQDSMAVRAKIEVYDNVKRLLTRRTFQGHNQESLFRNALQEAYINYYTRTGHPAELAENASETLRFYLSAIKTMSPETFLTFADIYAIYYSLKPKYAEQFKDLWRKHEYDERKILHASLEELAVVAGKIPY